MKLWKYMFRQQGCLLIAVCFYFSIVAAVHASSPLKVVVTLPTLGAIASEVGGEHVEVQVMAASSEDPHYVDARPNMILWLSDADALIANGLELEIGWLPSLQSAARNPKIHSSGPGFLEVASFVDIQEVPTGIVDRSMGDVHPGGNPHFLYDARAGMVIVAAIAEHLSKLDPTHQESYKKQAQRMTQQLKALVREEQQRFQKIPAQQRKVVAYHKSLVYLFDWLGLQESATIEPKPGVPPSPAHVANVLQIMRQQQITLILQEEFYPSKTSQTLAKLTKSKLFILPGGVRFQEGQTYLQHLKEITRAIHRKIEGES